MRCTPTHLICLRIFSILAGEALSSGDKGKQQLTTLLPRLFLYEDLPSEAVQRLLPLLATPGTDKRVLRYVYYLVQLLIGRGSAGTPSAQDASSHSKCRGRDAAR